MAYIDKYGNLRDEASQKVIGMTRNTGESDADYISRGDSKMREVNVYGDGTVSSGGNILGKTSSYTPGKITTYSGAVQQPIAQIPQFDIQAEIDKLRKAQTQAAIASLGKARDQSLSNLSAEKATIEPKYQQEKMKTKVNAQQSARSFDEYMAQRGGNRSGIAAQGQLMNNLGYQGAMGQLGTAEANAIADNARRVTDVGNAYNSDVATAEAGAYAQSLQNTISQMNQDRAFQQAQEQFAKQFGLSEAGVTGIYNGQSTMAAQQAALNKAIQEAGITGMYNGQITLPAQQWNQTFESNNAQQAFQNKLAEQQLALSQQKALSGGSGGSGGGTATERKQMAYGDALSKVQDWVAQGYTPEQIQNILYQNASDFVRAGLNINDLSKMAYNMYQNARFNSGGGHNVQ